MEPLEQEDLNNTVILENNYSEINLYYTNNPYVTSILIENISGLLIIELNYSINDHDFSLIRLFLPKEKFKLYSTSKDNLTIVCNIESIVLY